MLGPRVPPPMRLAGGPRIGSLYTGCAEGCGVSAAPAHDITKNAGINSARQAIRFDTTLSSFSRAAAAIYAQWHETENNNTARGVADAVMLQQRHVNAW